MDATNQTLKTFRGWLCEGRSVIRGSQAAYYLVDPDRTSGRGLFSYAQTQPFGGESDDPETNWVDIITAEEWETIKAERRQISRAHRIKIRRPDIGGTEIWCGPDVAIINLLKRHDYRYQPASRYWFNPNKDPEATAKAFEQGKMPDGKRIVVVRDWTTTEGPVL